jgi:hypothetical protein
MSRIASSNPALLESFSSYCKDSQTVLIPSASLCERLGEADIFLLSDEEAIGIAASCESDSRPTLVVVVENEIPLSFQQGTVDDLLSLPIRQADVVRVLRMHAQMQSLRALEQSSRAVPELVRKLHEDIQLARKIQRRLIREKFPPMNGITVKSKYWCGLKAGGDYFDVFEFPDGEHVGLILSDSSSYALSTGFIGSLVQFSVHVGQDDLSDPSRIVSALYGKLKEEMKERDRFSILFGILNRKTFRFRYADAGSVYGGVKRSVGGFDWVTKGEHHPLSAGQSAVAPFREISLEPGDRLMLISDGWGEALQAPPAQLLEGFVSGEEDPQETLNSMAFRLRKGVEKLNGEEAGPEFPMPPQDCSVLLFELAKNALRLAKG